MNHPPLVNSHLAVTLTLLVTSVVTARCSLFASDAHMRPWHTCDWMFLVSGVLMPLSQIPFVVIAWRTKRRSRALLTGPNASKHRGQSTTIVLVVGGTVLVAWVGFLLLMW
jgi:hypothetical protein